MTTQIYCLASAKGGSGKTVLCASFASFLAELDAKVLMIDLDNATHGMTLFYLNAVNQHRKSSSDDAPRGLFDDQTPALDRDVVTLPNKVHLLPATFDFGTVLDDASFDLRPRLAEVIAMARSAEYDYVFLDAQAGVDNYSRVAMRKDISDSVILVTEYDPLSAAGVERLKATLGDDLDYTRTWMLVNKMLPDFADAYTSFFEISRHLNPIPWIADVVRAYARRSVPLDLSHGNPFTLAVMQTLRTLLGDDTAARINAWTESRTTYIREPLDRQYREAEAELEGLVRRKAEQERAALVRRVLYTTVMTAAAAFPTGMLLASREALEALVLAPVSLSASIILVLSAGAYLFWRVFRGDTVERRLENARFARQMGVVEEKLNRLEVLRRADLRTLVAERGNA